ncbi:hypothetical protein COLO4_31055 [Corchorus olitorius]|uniref:Uncharacterized protein n=1 Tax=Corchorus olitorius TaxID=93759 RepID=A0A1R3H5S3_9ROSI|nr:hypothetical protein COLO4_31055 [Corchorus olitorius]
MGQITRAQSAQQIFFSNQSTIGISRGFPVVLSRSFLSPSSKP